MVALFKNITFDKDWIYAGAEVHSQGCTQIFKIKVHQREEKLSYNPECIDDVMKRELIRALRSLAMDVEDGKIKQHSVVSFAWG